jgi:DNA polymerase-1
VGGTVGFIKSLRRVIEDFRPDGVVVVWESGGSARRRSIHSEYKMNRKPEKLNRFYEDDIPDTDENRIHQIGVLTKLLAFTPICQVYVPDCEGDDVVAYLARRKFKTDEKTVLSCDRDFYQLLDDPSIIIYNSKRKNYILSKDVLGEYHVSAKNFALAKAICGDPGDNVDGVPGVGFKTLAKKIPSFSLETELRLDEVISYCQSRRQENKFYNKIVENEDLIRRNWKLVSLDATILTSDQIAKINHIVDNFNPRSDKIKFMQMVIDDGIKDLHIDDVFVTITYLSERWNLNEAAEDTSQEG